jgi:hypothetical protein
MAGQSPEQKEIVSRVMHEFKEGDLTRGRGGKVRNPRQAIAIALSEAGASNRQSPAENRRRLRQTEAKEARGKAGEARQGGPTRAELYRRAQQAGIPGRARMSKDELQRALAGR